MREAGSRNSPSRKRRGHRKPEDLFFFFLDLFFTINIEQSCLFLSAVQLS